MASSVSTHQPTTGAGQLVHPWVRCIHGSQAEIGSTARGAQRSVALLCARPLRVHSIGVMKSNGTFVAREERAVRKASLGRIEPTSSGARSLAERRR